MGLFRVSRLAANKCGATWLEFHKDDIQQHGQCGIGQMGALILLYCVSYSQRDKLLLCVQCTHDSTEHISQTSIIVEIAYIFGVRITHLGMRTRRIVKSSVDTTRVVWFGMCDAYEWLLFIYHHQRRVVAIWARRSSGLLYCHRYLSQWTRQILDHPQSTLNTTPNPPNIPLLYMQMDNPFGDRIWVSI